MKNKNRMFKVSFGAILFLGFVVSAHIALNAQERAAAVDTTFNEAVFSSGPPITATCNTKGYDCITSSMFVATENTTLSHDRNLQDATLKLNAILNGLSSAGQKIGKRSCLYRSKNGLLLIWVENTNTGPLSKITSQGITDPAKIADLLQIDTGGSGRSVAAGTKELLLELVWHEGVGYFWHCMNAGKGCTGNALAMAGPTTVHDATLIQATEKINSILAEASRKTPTPSTKLCIIMVPAGPVLSWVSRNPPLKTDRRISVGPQSKEYEKLINESLGINPAISSPSTGGGSSNRLDIYKKVNASVATPGTYKFNVTCAPLPFTGTNPVNVVYPNPGMTTVNVPAGETCNVTEVQPTTGSWSTPSFAASAGLNVTGSGWGASVGPVNANGKLFVTNNPAASTVSFNIRKVPATGSLPAGTYSFTVTCNGPTAPFSANVSVVYPTPGFAAVNGVPSGDICNVAENHVAPVTSTWLAPDFAGSGVGNVAMGAPWTAKVGPVTTSGGEVKVSNKPH